MGVKDGYGGPEMGVKVFKCVWRTLDEWEGPEIDVKGFGWVQRVLGPPHAPQTLYSIPIPDIPYHPSQLLHTHLSPLIPTKAFNTHPRPSTPTQKRQISV